MTTKRTMRPIEDWERRHGEPPTRGDWQSFAASLLWMAFPLAGLLTAHPSALRIAIVLAGFAAFVVCYGNALIGPWERHGWHARAGWIAAGAAVAAAMTILDRSDWGVLFIFLAVASGVQLREPMAYAALGLLAAICAGAMIAGGSNGYGVVSVAASSAGLGFLFVLMRRLWDTNRALSAAQDSLAQAAVEQERLRFARDLHDVLGHSLSVIALKAQLAHRLLDADPAGADAHIADVEAVTRGALVELRAAVAGYARPTIASELAGARSALEAAGIEPSLDATVDLPGEVEEVLAWTIREGTTNVLRHSGASTARIVVAGGVSSAAVEVIDDGRSSAVADPTGRGLAGLRERAARVGGSVEAGPASGGGYRLRVEVPLP
jgi:two-component system sensor histidine kinase DesK